MKSLIGDCPGVGTGGGGWGVGVGAGSGAGVVGLSSFIARTYITRPCNTQTNRVPDLQNMDFKLTPYQIIHKSRLVRNFLFVSFLSLFPPYNLFLNRDRIG